MVPVSPAATSTKAAPKSAPKKAAAKPAPTPAPAAAPAPLAPPAPAFTPVDGGPLQRNSSKAVAAMVVGIVSCCIVIVPIAGAFLGLFGGIVALVLGILGVKEVNRDPATFKGKGMAVTGIVLGSIMIVLGLLVVIALTVGLTALEEYCADNPDMEGCDEINKSVREDPAPLLAFLPAPLRMAGWSLVHLA